MKDETCPLCAGAPRAPGKLFCADCCEAIRELHEKGKVDG
jgi:hypothetical protein